VVTSLSEGEKLSKNLRSGDDRTAPVIAFVLFLLVTMIGAAGASALSFTAPITVGKAGESRGFPRVAVDSTGRGVVAWHNFGRGVSANGRIQAVLIDREGKPGTAKTLSDPSDDAANPEVGIDRDGRATIVWQARNSGRVQWTRLSAQGGQSPVENLPGDGSYPQVAVNEDGVAVVAWEGFNEASYETLRAALILPDGSVTPVQQVDGTAGSVDGDDYYSVAIDPLGRATVVWEDLRRGKPAVFSARIAADGNAGRRQLLSRPGRISYIGSVAVDDAGVSTVAWSERSGFIRVVRVRSDGTPGVARRLTGRGLNGSPLVVVDGSGRATVAWAGAGPLHWVRLNTTGKPGRRGSLKGAGLSDMAVGGDARVWLTWKGASPGGKASVKAMRLSRDARTGRVRTLSNPGEDVYDFQGFAQPRVAAGGGGGVAMAVWPDLARRNPDIRLVVAR
jgi:hypothetical protein